jgi:hypothetical protein
MVTPICNKAMEVEYWIDRMAAVDADVNENDIREFVRRRWPDLGDDVHEMIVREVLYSGCA